ncbi:hypothetical protein J1N35_011157 [Gossypium stocksii]|uniref:Uncharacterized protein n=1 Tax=Gossypium stocksii TaxID=47602 RepID=A0A9D3W1X0_9ROSI|nr:hypothetical protein J1N35_011157 [Gossypium stocksii]
MQALERASELNSKLKEKTPNLWGKNKDLAEHLVITEGNVEKLSREVIVERVEKESMNAAMKKDG